MSSNRIEDRLLERIDRANAPRPVRDRCPARSALEDAFHGYAQTYGWGEARAWAAMRAYCPIGPITNKAREQAEALFSGVGE